MKLLTMSLDEKIWTNVTLKKAIDTAARKLFEKKKLPAMERKTMF